MKTIHLRSLSVGALALLAFAGSAAAQARPPTMLNSLEVRQLIARAEPGDHARLGTHFAALADRYAAEAKRHRAMSHALAGNPNRRLARGNTHCLRLADLNTQSAATVRELATHHDRLAAGTASIAPRNSAPFERGEGAPDPTDEELNALAAKASTPAEHRALEEYFLTLAKRYTADANEHVAMAQAYMGARRSGFDAAAHCDRMVKLSRDSAREANAAAALHKELAGVAR